MKSESEYAPSDALRTGKQSHNSQNEQSEHGSKRSNGKVEWQRKVYKLSNENYESLQEYHSICDKVFYRDEFKCHSCLLTRYKLSRLDKFLTAHHIVPREDNGQTTMNNLITLCNSCHDIIEERGIRTKEEMHGLLSDDKRHWHREETYGKRWQEWVYGGRKKPN